MNGTFAVRQIDQGLARWVRRRSGSELVARAAFAVSQAEGQGHACAALVEGGAFDAAAIAELRVHPWVGAGDTFTPFVLDAGGNAYSWRNWQHETRLAAALRARAQARTLPVAADLLAADVAQLFGAGDVAATRWQRAAVAAIPGARVFVLTGGPGTGKTTTVLRMLLMLLRHAAACALPARPDIALAAPTGKAAQRLEQAIAEGRERLLRQLPPDSPFRPLLDAIPPDRAATLHRLLGYRPDENRFLRGPGNPLAADIVVVDEASMGDLAMMRRLLEALREQSVLILLGDPAQLAAVEAGSVLGDVVASVAPNRFPAPLARLLVDVIEAPPQSTGQVPLLAGQVVALTHGWRAGSGLQRGIDALRVADADWLDTFLDGGDGPLHRLDCADAIDLRARVDAWVDTHAHHFTALMRVDVLPRAALDRLRGAQVLCALRDGVFGARGVNALIARRLAAHFRFDADAVWYHGRPVIVTHNDYARRLYNGDIGIALRGAAGLRVWFDAGEAAREPRSFSPHTLPAHETAWAITIHRSQGSEYGHVAVVLPPDPDNRVLSRELLYTGVSRATSGVEIWAQGDVLRSAVGRPVRRHGGLCARLRVENPEPPAR